jgi:molybdate transport system ATP-binding protein
MSVPPDAPAAELDVAFRGALGSFTLDVAFRLPARGVAALFGPSGCGKTSVLRCLAGLTRLDGRCRIGRDVWQDGSRFLPPHRRAVGYVFQEASLFPHLSVEGNLLYGAPKEAQARAVGFDEVVALLGLAPLLARPPQHLSGGERQRVAIGRALLSQPRLLLMDEPLSALDALSRDEILPYLERLPAALAMPVVYVSHDLGEVERLADHLVLMRQGRVLAAGPIGALQADPELPLMQARQAAVSLDGVVTGYEAADGLASLAVEGGSFLVPSGPLAPGTRRRLRVLADDVSLATAPPVASTIVNVLPARILELRTAEHRITALLGLGADGSGARLLSRITARSARQLGLAPGQTVYAQVKGAALFRREPDA